MSNRLPQWAPNRTALLILESEFNKIGADAAPALDAALAAKADYFHAHLPGALVALGFGNFGGRLWDRFPAATQAVDDIGIQAMRAAPRDSPADYANAVNDTLRAALWMQRAFHKPILLHDVALSSYPEPAGLGAQVAGMRAFRQRQYALAAAGVQALIYRSWEDTPNMPSDNYFGDAEASWGLAWAGNGTLKPAGEAWIAWAGNAQP